MRSGASESVWKRKLGEGGDQTHFISCISLCEHSVCAAGEGSVGGGVGDKCQSLKLVM